MDSIVAYVKDPGWWFTAFFIAIFTSVIAGFLKDAIERRISAISSRYRSWRANKAAQREELISHLANDPTFLVLAYIRASLLLGLYLFMAIMFMLLPMLSEILQNTCGSALSVVACRAKNGSVAEIAIPILGLMTSFAGYKATSVLSVVSKALRRYREARGHPRVG